jgi:hypothetical protein
MSRKNAFQKPKKNKNNVNTYHWEFTLTRDKRFPQGNITTASILQEFCWKAKQNNFLIVVVEACYRDINQYTRESENHTPDEIDDIKGLFNLVCCVESTQSFTKYIDVGFHSKVGSWVLTNTSPSNFFREAILTDEDSFLDAIIYTHKCGNY